MGGRLRLLLVAVVAAIVAVAALGLSSSSGSAADEPSFLVLRSDGSVAVTGNAASDGGVQGALTAPAVAIESIPGTTGYYIVEANGRVTARGGAVHHGDLSGVDLNLPIVDIAVLEDGSGYYLTATDGGVFAFPPTQPFHGSLPSVVAFQDLQAPIVAMVVEPDASGYWLIAADGGVFAFGAAAFHGSVPQVVRGPIAGPIIAAMGTAEGGGYGLIGSDGGVFAFGDFTFGFSGSTSGGTFVDIADAAGGYALLGDTGDILGSLGTVATAGPGVVSFTSGVAADPSDPPQGTAPVSSDPPPGPGPGGFGLVELAPAFELDGPGSDIDSLAFWEAPNASQTLLLVTSKGTPLVEVWRHPFEGGQLTPLTHSSFGPGIGNGGGEVNGIVVDQELDLVYISTSEPENTLSVFRASDLSFVTELNQGRRNNAEEPNLDIYRHADGRRWIFLTADDVVYVLDADTGVELFRTDTGGDVETVLADEVWSRMWVPDEKDGRGLFVFDPDGSPGSSGLSGPFGGEEFEADAEGIVLYETDAVGGGYVIVSDQRDPLTDFEFFDRATGVHLGTLRLTGVAHTDGIASTQQAMPGYPLGIFAAINDDGTTVGIGWDVVLAAIAGG